MSRITAYVAKVATWKTILAAAVASFGMQMLFFLWIIPELVSRTGRYDPPDIVYFYGVDYLTEFLTLSNQAGLDYYVSHFFVLDLVFPLAFAVFWSLALMSVAKRLFAPGSRWLLVALMPFVGMLCDYLENVGIVVAISQMPDVSHNFLVAISVLSTLKTVIGAFSMLVFVTLLIALLIKRLRSRGEDSSNADVLT